LNDAIDPHIRRVFQAWDDQDADKAVEQFAEGGRFYERGGKEEFSKAELRDYLADYIFYAYPDYSIEETEVLTAHDWATVIEWSFRATFERPLGDTSPTGETVGISIVSVITVSDDGIDSWRDYTDHESYQEQVGSD